MQDNVTSTSSASYGQLDEELDASLPELAVVEDQLPDGEEEEDDEEDHSVVEDDHQTEEAVPLDGVLSEEEELLDGRLRTWHSRGHWPQLQFTPTPWSNVVGPPVSASICRLE